MIRTPYRIRIAASLLVVALLTACGDDDGPGEGDAALDAPMTGSDGRVMPDAGRPCTMDIDCDDGIACSRDACGGSGFCVHTPDDSMCSDGVFCNGAERCDVRVGCIAADPQTCNDEDVCTLDRCDEEAKLCRHAPRDQDEDGEADFHCADGTDCDDRDPRRGQLIGEVCGDEVDNDCDQMVDESVCGNPENDTCDDPLDISAGGSFVLSSAGALNDYDIECGLTAFRDLVTSFTITEPRDVTVTASAIGANVSLSLRESCGNPATEVECQLGAPGLLRARALEPGTYFIIVATWDRLEIDLSVEFAPATEPAPNETCADPIPILMEGRLSGSFLDATDDVEATCSEEGGLDLTYAFTLEEPRDVLVSAIADRDEALAVSVREVCEDGMTERRCVRGAPAQARLYELPAGTYYLVVESPSRREADFFLDFRTEAPTEPPLGESCANPATLFANTPTNGTLVDKQDDHPTSCGLYYRDAVYQFSLSEPQDVLVEVDGGPNVMQVAVQSTCGELTAERRCASGVPALTRVRDLPAGDYFVMVESIRGAGYDLSLEVLPPSNATEVTANGTCASAFEVPAEGGVFVGSTAVLINDVETATCGSMATSKDAAFTFELTEARRIIATTSGSTFDTVLHLHRDDCVSRGELVCDDDGGDGQTSLIDAMLDAGRYFLIVDGWGSRSAGDYVLEITFADP